MHVVQQQNVRIYLNHQSIVEEGPLKRHLSSQTSSMRQLLMMLLTIIVQPFTCGCQQ
jgi:hypothetical protein